MPHKYVVAIDFSVESRNALNRALSVMNRDDDELVLLHAAERMQKSLTNLVKIDFDTQIIDKVNEYVETESKARMDDLAAYVRDDEKVKNVRAVVVMCNNNARDALVEQINESKPTIAFIGSRGLGALKKLFLGSVSEYVASHVSGDVAVCVVHLSEAQATETRKSKPNRFFNYRPSPPN